MLKRFCYNSCTSAFKATSFRSFTQTITKIPQEPAIPKTPTVITALYKFVTIDDPEQIAPSLLRFCKTHGIRGTLLLGKEGLNGTVSGSAESIEKFLVKLKSDSRFHDIDHKESLHENQPFFRMKVKIKKEIVNLGLSEIDPSCVVGQYVEPKDWNKLISDPNVLLIDTRNSYEIYIGTFKNAVNPNTMAFNDFPAFVDSYFKEIDKEKKIAMFCTGGIRCEKSTSFLKSRGFSNVYHLKGGILKYLEEIPKEESLWEGECFVFDDRISVDHNLKKGVYIQCGPCKSPVTIEEQKSDKFLNGCYCPRCYNWPRTDEELQKRKDRQAQIDNAWKLKKTHFAAIDEQARLEREGVFVDLKDVIAQQASKKSTSQKKWTRNIKVTGHVDKEI